MLSFFGVKLIYKIVGKCVWVGKMNNMQQIRTLGIRKGDADACRPTATIILRGTLSTDIFGAHILVEDFNRAHGTNLKIAGNQPFFHRHLGTGWVPFLLGNKFPVDMLLAYRRPDVAFDDTLVYRCIVNCWEKHGNEMKFIVGKRLSVELPTGMYKGEKHIALYATGLQAADFKRDNTHLFLDIPQDRLVPFFGLPEQEGQYDLDQLMHLPCEPRYPDPVQRDNFWRPNGGGALCDSHPANRPAPPPPPRLGTYWPGRHNDYVGLVTRTYIHREGELVAKTPFVSCGRIDEKVGIVVEVPETDLVRIQQLRIDINRQVFADFTACNHGWFEELDLFRTGQKLWSIQ